MRPLELRIAGNKKGLGRSKPDLCMNNINFIHTSCEAYIIFLFDAFQIKVIVKQGLRIAGNKKGLHNTSLFEFAFKFQPLFGLKTF